MHGGRQQEININISRGACGSSLSPRADEETVIGKVAHAIVVTIQAADYTGAFNVAIDLLHWRQLNVVVELLEARTYSDPA